MTRPPVPNRPPPLPNPVVPDMGYRPLRPRLAAFLRRLANRLDRPKPPVTITITATDPVAAGRAIEAALLRYKNNGGRS